MYSGFEKVTKKKFNEWVRKIKDITGDIRTDNIIGINAISVLITRKLGLKAEVNVDIF